MWNKLHSDLKNSTTVNMFKKRYKTFLVSEYEATQFLAKIAISISYFFVWLLCFTLFLPPLNDQGNATYTTLREFPFQHPVLSVLCTVYTDVE